LQTDATERERERLTVLFLFRTAAAEVDDSKLAAFMKEIEGKDIAELIAEGNAKLASVPSGGGGGGGGGAAAGGDAGAAEAAPAAEEEEEEADMDFDLFD
jgi:large subunit ribosomal protein LP2